MTELIKPAKVRTFKSLKWFTTQSGQRIIVLPTCSVPLTHLIKENWAYSVNLGTTRSVRAVYELKNWEKTRLIVKKPERVFSSKESEVRKGNIWPTTTKHVVSLHGEDARLVEEQANWEARILVGLARMGEKAEEPQAIVVDKDGSKALITKYAGTRKRIDLFEQVADAIHAIIKGRFFARKGIEPRDVQRVRDEDGQAHYVDVSRWSWHPYTDAFHKKLMEAILKQ